jgi:hypothetical protein
MFTPRTTAPPGGVRGRPIGGPCLGFGFGLGLWLCVGVGVGDAWLGVGLTEDDLVGVADVGGEVDVDDDERADDEPKAEADEAASPDDVADRAAVDRPEVPAAADARPPAHGSSTIPTDIRTTPAHAHVRPAREIRPARERMVVLVGRFGLGVGVMTRPPLAGAFWPGAWLARLVVIRLARER